MNASNYFNPFAGTLYNELRKSPGNLFCSPYSISTALAMTAAGAKGETRNQMRKVLGFGDNPAASDAACEIMGKALEKHAKGFELSVANAVWAQPGYPWNPEYTKKVQSTFKAAVHDADFQKNTEAARQRVNDWVEKQTKEKIKDLLARGSVTSRTRMVLANAIYFKGEWLKAFEKKRTAPAPFTLLDGTKKDVPLMQQQDPMSYAESDTAQVVMLPYKGNEISFVAALPRKPESFKDGDGKLLDEAVTICNRPMKTSRVQLYLPRFKVETACELNNPLQSLGMTDAFSEIKADFGGMVTTRSELFISLVMHKAFVDVNEEGTEAAAATGVVVELRAAPIHEPKVFRADRPFVFALRHNPTGTILFSGRYTTP